jgi:hypothetical protein
MRHSDLRTTMTYIRPVGQAGRKAAERLAARTLRKRAPAKIGQ